MRTRLLLLSLLLMLFPAGCLPGGEPLKAADCEGLSTKSACEKKGCTFAYIDRAIMDGPVCVASERRPGCLAAGESVNNMVGAVCRDLPGGGFEFVIFSSARAADGWSSCEGDIFNLCDGPVTACGGLTDQAACEAAHCFWAEPVRVAVIDDEGACTGWEQPTTALCLTPEPYLTYIDGVSTFVRPDAAERFFEVTPVEGPRRVYAFPVNAIANFSSGPPAVPDFWRDCNSATSAPCSCP